MKIEKEARISFGCNNLYYAQFASIILMHFTVRMAFHVVLVAKVNIANLAPVMINKHNYIN